MEHKEQINSPHFQWKHMLWVLKGTISLRLFFSIFIYYQRPSGHFGKVTFEHPSYGYEIYLQFYAKKLCLSKPMWYYSLFNFIPDLDVIKLFSSTTQLSTKFQLLIITKIRTNKEVSCSKSLSQMLYLSIVGILTLMSRINFVLSWVEHGKGFITLGPGH